VKVTYMSHSYGLINDKFSPHLEVRLTSRFTSSAETATNLVTIYPLHRSPSSSEERKTLSCSAFPLAIQPCEAKSENVLEDPCVASALLVELAEGTGQVGDIRLDLQYRR
jgi:hypothetical protein